MVSTRSQQENYSKLQKSYKSHYARNTENTFLKNTRNESDQRKGLKMAGLLAYITRIREPSESHPRTHFEYKFAKLLSRNANAFVLPPL